MQDHDEASKRREALVRQGLERFPDGPARDTLLGQTHMRIQRVISSGSEECDGAVSALILSLRSAPHDGPWAEDEVRAAGERLIDAAATYRRLKFPGPNEDDEFGNLFKAAPALRARMNELQAIFSAFAPLENQVAAPSP
ncbi:hypothetical protein ACEUZ9_005490 [Paracoccus litorisediminis]|uniref:hypothetical protein n=1 Tax=Paracoccus litorisediminis TaxID=2006130 RepID=UPI00373031F2